MSLFNGHSNMGRKDSGIGPMRELFARDNTSRDRSCSNFTLSSFLLSKLFATMIRSSFVQSPNDAGNVSFIMFESSRSFRCEHWPMIAEIGPARSLLDNHNFSNKGALNLCRNDTANLVVVHKQYGENMALANNSGNGAWNFVVIEHEDYERRAFPKDSSITPPTG